MKRPTKKEWERSLAFNKATVLHIARYAVMQADATITGAMLCGFATDNLQKAHALLSTWIKAATKESIVRDCEAGKIP